MKFIEIIILKNNSDISHSNIFSDMSPQSRETKEKLIKWDYT